MIYVLIFLHKHTFLDVWGEIFLSSLSESESLLLLDELLLLLLVFSDGDGSSVCWSPSKKKHLREVILIKQNSSNFNLNILCKLTIGYPHTPNLCTCMQATRHTISNPCRYACTHMHIGTYACSFPHSGNRKHSSLHGID